MSTATLLPTSDESSAGTIFYSSGATAFNLLDDDDNDTNHIRFDSDGFISMNYSNMGSAALTINSVTMHYKYADVGAHDTQQGRGFVKIGGTKYYSGYENLTTSGGTHAEISSSVWTLNPATSAPWTTITVNALIAGVELSGYLANSTKFTLVSLVVDYLTNPATVEVTRHLASVDLWLKKRPESFLTITGNLDLLNVPMLGIFEVEHTAAPHATDLGYEDEVWQRRPFAVHGIDIDPNTSTVTMELKDQRPIRCLVRDLAWSDKSSGVLADGIARFMTPGATFTFTRASEETFTNPVGESETVPANIPGYADGGLLMAVGSRAYYSNNTGKRTWSASQGTFQCEIYLLGALAENRYIAYAYHDANNAAAVYYDNASGKIKFAINAAGVLTTITGTTTVSNNRWIQLGVYWTGVNLENGLAAYSMRLYHDRVLEASGTATGVMTEAASSNFDIGSAAGTAELRGQIRKIHSHAHVFTPLEMTRPI